MNRPIFIVCVFLLFCSTLFSDEYNGKILSQYRESYKYEQMGNYVDAFRVLLPVYRKYPATYTINMRLGWLCFRMNKYSDAQSYYSKAELKMPASVELKNMMIRLFLACEQWKKAESKCNVVLSRDYYNFYSNLYLARSYLAQRKFTEAESIARKMLVIYPTNVLFLTNLGLSLLAQKKTSEAVYVFQSVIVLDPENVTAKKYLKK